MSRNLFDDIFEARGLKGLLSPPEMDNAVPKQGSILSGFDYRKPFESAGLENALAQTDTSFAPMSQPISTNDIWRARALSAEFAQQPPVQPNHPAMPQAESWPTVYKDKVTEPWNNPRDGSKNHQGVDFRNYFGEPVFSVSDGVITEINNNPAGRAGTYMMVRDANGNLYGYAHTGAVNGLKVETP